MGNAGFIPSTVGGVLGEAFEGFLPFEGWSKTCRAGLCGGIRLARFQEAAFKGFDSFALQIMAPPSHFAMAWENASSRKRSRH